MAVRQIFITRYIELIHEIDSLRTEFTEEGGGLKYLTSNFFIFGYSLAFCFHQIKGSCCLGNRGSVRYFSNSNW